MQKFQVDKYLLPNEYIFTNQDITVSTVLGTCVAIILHSKNHHYTGALHGMISDKYRRSEQREIITIESLFKSLLEEFKKIKFTNSKNSITYSFLSCIPLYFSLYCTGNS